MECKVVKSRENKGAREDQKEWKRNLLIAVLLEKDEEIRVEEKGVKSKLSS